MGTDAADGSKSVGRDVEVCLGVRCSKRSWKETRRVK